MAGKWNLQHGDIEDGHGECLVANCFECMRQLLIELGEPTGVAPCSFCKSHRGQVREHRPGDEGGEVMVTCPSCNGSGKAEGFVMLVISEDTASFLAALQGRL